MTVDTRRVYSHVPYPFLAYLVCKEIKLSLQMWLCPIPRRKKAAGPGQKALKSHQSISLRETFPITQLDGSCAYASIKSMQFPPGPQRMSLEEFPER